MINIESKKVAIDALLLSLFSLMMLPILILGLHPLALLTTFLVLVFSYFSLRERTIKNVLWTMLAWPIATVLITGVLKDLILATPRTIVFFWFSVPGCVLFFSVAAASLIATKLMVNHRAKPKGLEE